MAPVTPSVTPRAPDQVPLDTVGYGQAVDRIRALAEKATASVFAIDLPRESLPAGLLVDAPKALAIRHGDGRIEIKPISGYLDGLLAKPARRRGVAHATTLESFCALVNRNGDDGSVLFLDANWKAPSITAVLNYHIAADADADADLQPAAASPGDDPLARFGDHRVTYAFPLSESWKAWVAQDKKWLTSEDFSRWLEDHIAEIAVPDTEPGSPDRMWEERFRSRIALPNELVDFARDLSIVVNAKMKQKTRLESGETAIVFETEHTDLKGQPVAIPGLFVLSLPIFFRGIPQRVLARLRYRPAGGDGVLWAYELHRPDEAVDERVVADAAEIRHQTGRLIIHGSPEA